MEISIPELSLILLVGPSGSGKSTFASEIFQSTEVVSSDFCRALLVDDETDQSVTSEAFDLLHTIVEKRLALGRLTVVDATNVQSASRKPLIALARKYHVLPVAIVFRTSPALCLERNAQRENRSFGSRVIKSQLRDMKRGLKSLKREGFRYIFNIQEDTDPGQINLVRQPLWNNKKCLSGPFDIIGDVHGCCDELEILLSELGYEAADYCDRPGGVYNKVYTHPEGRKAIFLGDLVDRGPRVLDTLYLVKNMVDAGKAWCVPGNHDVKFLRHLKGKQVRINHGLNTSLADLETLVPESCEIVCEELRNWLDGLVSHYVFDQGQLVVAHAGMKESMQGRGSGRVREFALYGETTGETDEFGLPVRYNWALEYEGSALMVYGHTPVPEPDWLNRTVNIDTGCVFGGALTALRYPERECISVPAAKTYCEPVKPLQREEEKTSGSGGFLLAIPDIGDFLKKYYVETDLRSAITVREENVRAAVEVISRFGVDPRWLIYLPPTMSPSETSTLDSFLEHPLEAVEYYRKHGIDRLVCQQKHMGSRAVIIVGRDCSVIEKRFGLANASRGIIHTRTGRAFFKDTNLEKGILERFSSALERAGFWDEFESDWFCFDCELMPWSAKARELLISQYAATGAAGELYATSLHRYLEVAENKPEGFFGLRMKNERQMQSIQKFRKAYQRYCWPVSGIDDYRIAPFHLLASEGTVYTGDQYSHVWHMETLGRLCDADTSSLLIKTPFRIVDTADPQSIQNCVDWWEQITEEGWEGMVVKPETFVAKSRKGLLQPAVKCRGREYLRIIYGHDYDQPENLERLRQRSLRHKRSMAIREFALGLEALKLFVNKDSFKSVHASVLGILALESEPVDPRL